MKHIHDWFYVSEHRYRDEEEKEYHAETYKCECGAGQIIKTPMELFLKGYQTLGKFDV